MNIVIRRRDPARKMARFYSLRLQGDLLAGLAVIREWGRIGRAGRVRVDLSADAEAEALRLAAQKRRRGYA